VAVLPTKEATYTTDAGHIDVIGPDGRLLHRFTDGAAGISGVALDLRGHLFVSTGWGAFINGEGTSPAGGLAMYDVDSLALLRRFDVTVPDSEYYDGQFSLSPDGRDLAASINKKGGGFRVDVFDVATGKRTLQIPVPGTPNVVLGGYAVFDGPNLVVRTGAQTWQVRSASTGAIIATRTLDGWNPPNVFGGIMYESHDDARGSVQSMLAPTTTIARRETTSGRMLPPIVVKGMVFEFAPVDPDPSVTFTASADAAPPSFPSLAQLRERLRPDARGVEFDDAVTSKRFTYLGDYARIDDPGTHSVTIVDCTRQVALVADTNTRLYRVLRMDATTIDEHGAPDQFLLHLRPPASVVYAFSDVHRAQLRSPLAAMGYAIRYTVSPNGSTQYASVLEEEQEYASGLAAVYPSCARHSFDGEPLWIEPPADPDLPSAASVEQAYPPGIVSIVGAQPPIPRNSLRVHVEIGHGAALVPVLDLRNVHPLARAAVTQFAPPDGYAQDRSVRY